MCFFGQTPNEGIKYELQDLPLPHQEQHATLVINNGKGK
jgi:hypothetical protein